MRSIVITNIDFDDWVLGGIARDIAKRGDSRLVITNFRRPLSIFTTLIEIILAHDLVFVNHDTFLRVYRLAKWFAPGKKIKVLYTHTETSRIIRWSLLHNLDIVCINETEKRTLIDQGIDSKRVTVCPTGVDFTFFAPPEDEPDLNRVLLVSNFKERKNPSLLLDVVTHNPDFRFTLIGRGWENSLEWDSLQNLCNFTYVEFSHSAYRNHLAQNHIFLSLSTLEGGPLPMLESMACNLTPICTSTGWAPDLIEEGKNGLLLPVEPRHADVRKALLQAAKMKMTPRDSISQYTYDRYLSNFIF